MVRALLWLAPLFVFVGCSSSDSPEGPTDGGSDPPAEAGGEISDAGEDAAHWDGSAAVDAGDGGDAAAKGGCNGSTLKLCEDFDTSTVGQTPTGWTVLKSNFGTGSPTLVASDDYHSPPSSLKTSTDKTGANRVMKSLASLGTTAGTHWGRVFWKVKSPAPHPIGNGQGPHVPFVALQGNLRANELRVVDTQQFADGKIQLLVNTPDDACCKVTNPTYTIWDGTWHCQEWYVDHATQSYRSFLDRKEITALAFDYGAGSTTANMPTAFSAVGLGAYFFADLQAPLTAWFDDLAIDDKQIGCN